ncbi:MAG: hypothetical protein RL033_218, partial [Pseudomonadota bacterium]
PAMFLMLGPPSDAWWMLPVPTMAQVATVVRVMRGDSVAAWQLLVIGVSSLAYSAVCLACLERLLRRERIIFGR